MSDKNESDENAAINITSPDKDVPGISLSQVPTFNLKPIILSERNLTIDPPKAGPPKPNLRQLIVSIHDRTSPKDSQKLPNAELSRLVRSGDVLLRRMRRLVLSGRRFIDLEPMLPLQEEIAQELAKQLGCLTRHYNGPNDSRYMVVYRPGVEPNSFELRARRMCQKDKGQEIYVVDEEIQMEPMFFRDGVLQWHQPMEWGDHQRAAEPVVDSLSLGRQILVEFNRDHQAHLNTDLDQKDTTLQDI